MSHEVDGMTEKELEEKRKELEELMSSGHATVRMADRLAEVRKALRRIGEVKNGTSW